MKHRIDRDWPDWYLAAEAVGIEPEELAFLTGKSYSAVYKYATGGRSVPADWLVQVWLLVRSRQARAERGDAA